MVSSTNWRRVVASGALWALVYNLVWGLAWFAFMRREWERAMAAVGRPVPFTAEVWFVWVVLTFPIGMAVMAYSADHPRFATRAALLAAGGTWLVIAGGTTVWGWTAALSMRVLAADASVNLAAMAAASLAGAWSQREVQPDGDN